MTHNLSADGRRVIFDSADRLVAADENEVNDVYEWEAKGEGTCASEAQAGGCLYLLSGGAAGAEPSYFADADAEGRNAFIFTSRRLVAQDKDELVDLYDARVEGGIAAQEAVPPTPCRGEECSEPPAGAPAGATPRSPGAAGANVVPRSPCKRGFVRKHGRCVHRHKKHHRHRKHHHKKLHGKKHGSKHHGKKHHKRGKGGRR